MTRAVWLCLVAAICSHWLHFQKCFGPPCARIQRAGLVQSLDRSVKAHAVFLRIIETCTVPGVLEVVHEERENLRDSENLKSIATAWSKLARYATHTSQVRTSQVNVTHLTSFVELTWLLLAQGGGGVDISYVEGILWSAAKLRQLRKWAPLWPILARTLRYVR
ncbi:unnamed protein product [Effrenium voratum]|nr:unnamed protein product [Effrenium voratum]